MIYMSRGAESFVDWSEKSDSVVSESAWLLLTRELTHRFTSLSPAYESGRNVRKAVVNTFYLGETITLLNFFDNIYSIYIYFTLRNSTTKYIF